MAIAYKGKPQCIIPPNTLKRKLGTGGIDEAVLARAQANLENNTVDFQPLAARWLGILEGAILGVKSGHVKNKAEVEMVLLPVVKLKEQGSMFRFPLVTEASAVVSDLLETAPRIDKDMIDLLMGYKRAISAIMNHNMTGDGGAEGRELVVSLTEATDRYRNLFAN